jgi:hypothetical protein
MSEASQNIKLLHNFTLGWVFFHELFINRLEGYKLTRKSMDSQIHFSKSSFSHYFANLVGIASSFGGRSCLTKRQFNLFHLVVNHSSSWRQFPITYCWILCLQSQFFSNNLQIVFCFFLLRLPLTHGLAFIFIIRLFNTTRLTYYSASTLLSWISKRVSSLALDIPNGSFLLSNSWVRNNCSLESTRLSRMPFALNSTCDRFGPYSVSLPTLVALLLFI